MGKNKRCLYCYQKLGEETELYHPACSKKFYGNIQPPQLPYRLDEITDLAKNIVRSHITITGVQTKLSLNLERYRKAGGRFTIVGLWGNYILKPPVDNYPEMPEIEDLTMHLAKIFNISTIDHSLIPMESGELAYLTRRMDRAGNGQKIHLEDMCQLTERLTEDKYKGSMEQVGKTIQRYSSNPMLDTIRFFEVSLFSFLTGNADMHLKNFSLVYPLAGMIQLAPAYDLLSTRLLIPVKADPEEMALSLNGKKSKIQLKDFEIFSQNLGLSEKQFQNTLTRFRKNLNSALKFINCSFLSKQKKIEYEQLISSRAQRLYLLSDKQ